MVRRHRAPTGQAGSWRRSLFVEDKETWEGEREGTSSTDSRACVRAGETFPSRCSRSGRKDEWAVCSLSIHCVINYPKCSCSEQCICYFRGSGVQRILAQSSCQGCSHLHTGLGGDWLPTRSQVVSRIPGSGRCWTEGLRSSLAVVQEASLSCLPLGPLHRAAHTRAE